MPAITEWRSMTNGDKAFSHVNSVGSAGDTFTFPFTADQVEVFNEGINVITVTSVTPNATIDPGKSRLFAGKISSIAIASNSAVNAISIAGVGEGSDDVEITGRNTQLLPETTITWNGVKTSDVVVIPVTTAQGIMLNIDNFDTANALTVTFEIEVTTNEYRQWKDGQGGIVSFTVDASSKFVYGPFQAFPRYLKGRIKLTAASAPANLKVTKVQVQEVV